ncbi:MAG: aldehyde ferredoxin oxidoreductase C-terminal domain-containing protein, partial [Dehalococcoidia bacterium]
NKACFACTIACGRVTRLPQEAADKYLVTMHPRNWRRAAEGPEYETVWALGPDCGVDDLDAVIKANFLCNDLGMDPISLGGTLAAAMELYEKGHLTSQETGIPLRFGDAAIMLQMVEAAAYRRGFGDQLAEGAQRLTAKFGRPDLFMGVKGQELPAYDPRGAQGMGLTYATANRGGDHLRGFTVEREIMGNVDPDATIGKAKLAKEMQDENAALDATGLCIFVEAGGAGLNEILPVLTAATGVESTLDDLRRAGERVWNVERLWNLRAGISARDDTLPRRLLKEPTARGKVSRLAEMLPEYYRLRGWTEDGHPTPEKLEELGII